jgi:hypothetical protein
MSELLVLRFHEFEASMQLPHRACVAGERRGRYPLYPWGYGG